MKNFCGRAPFASLPRNVRDRKIQVIGYSLGVLMFLEIAACNIFLFFYFSASVLFLLRIFAELGLGIHAGSATEVSNERVLGDVARLVGQDRASLNNASIMALLLFYLKENEN
jgi:hypothetical protein